MANLFESGRIELLNSQVLEFEINQMPTGERKLFCQVLLEKTKMFLEITEEARNSAIGYEANGIRQVDALHLGIAYHADIHYFCTCDDRFYRKATKERLGKMKVVQPIQLLEELENEA